MILVGRASASRVILGRRASASPRLTLSRHIGAFSAIAILAACSSSGPPPTQPTTPQPADAAIAIDAAPDGPPTVTLETKPWIFRFASAARTETWTLWFASGVAVLNVQPANSALTQYQGTATDGALIVIEVASATAKLKLDCKRAKREVDQACEPPPPPTSKRPRLQVEIDALDCYVAGFKEPMPFGHERGIEYSVDGTCPGYHLLAP